MSLTLRIMLLSEDKKSSRQNATTVEKILNQIEITDVKNQREGMELMENISEYLETVEGLDVEDDDSDVEG